MKKLISFLLLTTSIAFADWSGWGDPSHFKVPIEFDSTVTINDDLYVKDSTFHGGAVVDSNPHTFLDHVTIRADSNETAYDTSLAIYWADTNVVSANRPALVITMDTTLASPNNTRVTGLKFDGTASNRYDDYWIYCNVTNNWESGGVLRNIQINTSKMLATGNFDFIITHIYSHDFLFNYSATHKGDIICRDGNLGVANPDFFQIQDSAGTMKAQISNTGNLVTAGKILPSGAGDSLTKFVKIGSHCAVIVNASDTMWLASDTTGF